ncbi:MAG: hypothetical protein QNJ72_44395 [Pleurocapsa sp. MO_226.B13]|nr:hypothetical protein [Pleurocapsa sp. MO_226.B13]
MSLDFSHLSLVIYDWRSPSTIQTVIDCQYSPSGFFSAPEEKFRYLFNVFVIGFRIICLNLCFYRYNHNPKK